MATINNSFLLKTKILEPIEQDSAQTIARAMIDVIREFFINNSMKFEFLIYGEITTHIFKVINEVTKELSSEVELKIRHIQEILNWNHELNQSAVILTRSQLNFLTLQHKSIMTNTMHPKLLHLTPKQFKFLVYVEEIKNLEQLRNSMVNTIYSLSMSDIRYFEFIMTNDEISVNLTANVLYSEEKCTEFHLKLLNSFDMKSQKWSKKLKKFNHYDNFYGCFVSLLVQLDHFWFFELYIVEKKHEWLTSKRDFTNGGLIDEMANELSKTLNITFHYTFYEAGFSRKLLVTNNLNINDSLGIVINANALLLNHRTGNFMIDLSTNCDFYYLITMNDLYTNYEKLLMPFDLTTWILLTATLVLTFALTFGSYKFPQWIRSLIFGQDIRDPTFKALGMIFGIAQLKLPNDIVNRAALALFMRFFLIFRTCYQSMLFEFMTTDMRKPLPASFDDLREMNYSIIFLDPSFGYYLMIQENAKGRMLPNIWQSNELEFRSLYTKALDDKLNSKIAFFVSAQQHLVFNITYKRSLPIMNNERLSKTITYTMVCNSLLVNDFSKITSQLISTGIAQQLINYGKWLWYRPLNHEIIDPRRVLSLSDLEFGFVLWLILLSLPVTCFLCEILSTKLRKITEILGIILVDLKGRMMENILRSFLERINFN